MQWSRTPRAWIASRPGVERRGDPSDRAVPPHLQALAATLLAIDGDHLCIPDDDRGGYHLVFDSTMFNQPRGRSARFRPGHCHDNVAALWRQDRAAHTICTGYALSAFDRMWRRHSWALHRDGRLIETTDPRARYFGVPVTGARALWFGLF